MNLESHYPIRKLQAIFASFDRFMLPMIGKIFSNYFSLIISAANNLVESNEIQSQILLHSDEFAKKNESEKSNQFDCTD